jgi:glycosylphosphatidylinositol transamidase (GPIT) subunit GPI8
MDHLVNSVVQLQVDYRGYEVTVENFIRVLTGRLPPSTPRSKRLLSDNRSNILVYMTGHGGDGFLKFQVIILLSVTVHHVRGSSMTRRLRN